MTEGEIEKALKQSPQWIIDYVKLLKNNTKQPMVTDEEIHAEAMKRFPDDYEQADIWGGGAQWY